MKNMKRALRRFNRDTKAKRRLAEDRNQHYKDLTCPCSGEDWLYYEALEDERRGRPSNLVRTARLTLTPYNAYRRIFGRMADTPKLCSCYMCGNPRRFPNIDGNKGLTMQELRAGIDPKYPHRYLVEELYEEARKDLD